MLLEHVRFYHAEQAQMNTCSTLCNTAVCLIHQQCAPLQRGSSQVIFEHDPTQRNTNRKLSDKAMLKLRNRGHVRFKAEA